MFYLDEAIAFCESQLSKQPGDLQSLSGHWDDQFSSSKNNNLNDDDEQSLDTFVSTKQLNKQ